MRPLRPTLVLAAVTSLTCAAHAHPSVELLGTVGAPPTVAPTPAPSAAEALAVDRLQQGAPAEALLILDEAIRARGLERSPRTRWLRARALQALGRPAEALTEFDALIASDDPLRGPACVLATRLGDAEPLATFDDRSERCLALDSISTSAKRSMRLAIGLRAAARGERERAIDALRQVVADTEPSVGAASAALPLAALLLERSAPGDAAEALGLYRRVASRAPRADEGRQARRAIEALAAALPEAERDAMLRFPVADAMAEARIYFESMRHGDAVAAYDAIARRDDATPEVRCDAMLQAGRAQLRAKERTDAHARMRDIITRCTADAVLANARYNAAQASAGLGENARALAEYDDVAAHHPSHPLADDALVRAAKLAAAAQDTAAAIARLRRVTTATSPGDMIPDAYFELAWRARRAGDFAGALNLYDEWVARDLPETGEDVQGRAPYWRARTLESLGRTDEATRAYEALQTSAPLSYYAMLGLTRLDELAPALARRSFDATVGELTPMATADSAHASLQVGRALLLVGERDLARDELTRAAKEAREATVTWAAASLLLDAAAPTESTKLVRGLLRRHDASVSPRTDAARWRVAYPFVYPDALDAAHAAQGIDHAWMLGVMREESSFDPTAFSTSHAHGLMQLIAPTAERFGRLAALPYDRASLFEPRNNVGIAARYLRFLHDRYPTNVAVVPAAYNAGERAVDRWLRANPGRAFDEWVEEIPYEETRRYTRRVLQSVATYAALYDGRRLVLPSALPTPVLR